MDPAASPDKAAARPSLSFVKWTDSAVLAVAFVAVASGFGQFGAVAALGSVADAFGHVTHGATIADQAGLSGTELGIGLAVIRLASLGGLPISGIADRLGRRGTLLATTAIGLALTVLAAASPSYWWFVAIFALGRPALSATNALAQVNVAEQTASSDRAKAIALVTAGYGVGAGLIAIIHSLGLGSLGFRAIFALSAIPLVLLLPLKRYVAEPQRFEEAASGSDHPFPVLGAVGPRFRRRLAVVATITFFISVITGPANSFVFLYAQDIVHQAGYLTAAMVVGAGVCGLLGLLLGRLLADRVGRRPAAAIGMIGLACFGVLTYSGGHAGLVVGYLLGVLSGSVLAPGLGAIVNEVFPTSVRASVAGWVLAAGVVGAVVGLVVFGTLADVVGNHFGQSALVTFLPAALAAGLFLALPESRGREPEELTGSSPSFTLS